MTYVQVQVKSVQMTSSAGVGVACPRQAGWRNYIS